MSEFSTVLALLPPCTQCGQPFGERACGVAHAIIAVDPLRHRLFELLVAKHDTNVIKTAWDAGYAAALEAAKAPTSP